MELLLNLSKMTVNEDILDTDYQQRNIRVRFIKEALIVMNRETTNESINSVDKNEIYNQDAPESKEKSFVFFNNLGL